MNSRTMSVPTGILGTRPGRCCGIIYQAVSPRSSMVPISGLDATRTGFSFADRFAWRPSSADHVWATCEIRESLYGAKPFL